MSSRRRFLATVAGTAAVTSLAGCLGFFDDEDDASPEDGDGEDELLSALADPSSQVPPLFFSGYQYRVSELEASNLDPAATIPRAGGAVARLFASEDNDLDLSTVEQITGSIYHATASSGSLQVQTFPSGQAVHATGEFSADPLLALLEDSDLQESLGERDGYERYIAEIQDGGGLEAWGVRDGRLIIVNRTDVTDRTPQYEAKEETAEDALAIEFDQVERDDVPIADAVPAFAESVQELDEGPIRAGTAYALVPRGSDIGTDALDETVDGVVGAGLSATLDSEPSLHRAVTYLDAELTSEERIRSAYEAAEAEEIPVDSWEFATTDATITARASLSEIPSGAKLQTALPVPGYQSLFVRVNPEELNRAATPRVIFRPSVEDGRLRITHTAGEEVTDLRVRYVHDGAVRHEDWEGPVGDGAEFTSAESIDSGTRAWVTWRPDTVDGAVLSRFETPA